ncbi:hypothetical protein Syun_017963 [Stephania yunnanensis]|uniref:Endonuclease/exonuclease/phosphatase domain-containing protein n=1 Tax=Stephania yunnanensis TaxID=152371 RepID=A0AAP0ITM6_9MAGN
MVARVRTAASPYFHRLSHVPQILCARRMSQSIIEPSLPSFVSVEPTNPNSINIRVVSYNILAQVFVKSSNFPHSPPPCLRWKARSQAVLTVLKSVEADFLCLQEVDEYDTFYKRNMEENGYSSTYIKRNGQKQDGCGIFYKHNFAELVLEEKIEFNDLADLIQDGNSSSVNEQDDSSVDTAPDKPLKNASRIQGDPSDPRVRLKRDCVGIMAAFKLKDTSQQLVILANTHIYWDPEWADVKLAQAKYLLLRLAQFKAIVSNKFDCTPSVIVCGDFNSTPGDKVYQYLVEGDSSSSQTQDDSKDVSISLRSVYAVLGGEPTFTNCTPDFTNTLDYIFFSPSGQLKPVGFIELPALESSDLAGGLPNSHYPSDHLPIGANFEVPRT